jgi:hypothetical protein
VAREGRLDPVADEEQAQHEEESQQESQKKPQSRWEKLDEEDTPPEKPERRSYSDTYGHTGPGGG